MESTPAVQTSSPLSLFLPKSSVSTPAWLRATLAPLVSAVNTSERLPPRPENHLPTGRRYQVGREKNRKYVSAELRGQHRKEWVNCKREESRILLLLALFFYLWGMSHQ